MNHLLSLRAVPIGEFHRIYDAHPQPMTARRDQAGADREAALMAELARGDEAAMEELCARYSAPLYGLGRRLLPDRGMAEELVQDTMVRLWRSAERYDSEIASVRTFVFTLARRAAIDLQRRAASRPLVTATGEERLPPDPGQDPYERMLLGLEVRDAMQALSEDHRKTLELYFDADLSQRDIAERMKVPVGTVKTRTHYALRELRTHLEERQIAN